MIKRSILAASVLMALAVTPALGQEHEHDEEQKQGAMMGDGHASMMGDGHASMMEQMHGHMMSGMQSMHPGPGMLLRASDQLGLTSQQTERLTALKERTAGEHGTHMRAVMTAHEKVAAAVQARSPDLDAYADGLNEAADHMVAAHLTMTRAALEAREVLTPEQREKLGNAMSMMREMHGGMKEGRMMEKSTMKHGSGQGEGH